MKQEDLAFVADALLALCEKDQRRPFFTEAAIDIKIKREKQRNPLFAQLALRSGDDVLLKEECKEIFRHANLTQRQADVLALRLEGFTFDEIGRRGGHTKQGAQSIFSQALKKIVRSVHVYPYIGLSDVYRREVRRGQKRGLVQYSAGRSSISRQTLAIRPD